MQRLTSAQWLIAGKMSESELLWFIIDAARKLGARFVWHDTDSRKNEKNLPDLLIITRDYRFLAWELKTEAEARRMRAPHRIRRPTKHNRHMCEQLMTIGEFRRSGIRSRVVRPRDWLSGWVEEQLAA